ncbi:MAG TPA: curli-like amyloid fiber formation chaperone CsgH [Burkholderiales bacterium]|nr:curli-like amyloid fiber formation chaperone CsgH [Burkholderiales bacterium]
MKKLVATAFAFLSFGATAADSLYQVDLGASLRGGNLKVEPEVTGPAGKELHYKMEVRREGAAGNLSNSSQGGTVRLDRQGHARLASSSVNVSPNDRYEVTLRVMEGSRVVAEKSEQYP